MRAATDWRAVAVAISAGVVASFYVGKLPGSLPALTSSLGLSLVAASALVSTFSVLAVLAAPLFGLAADRVGPMRFTLAGLGLLAAGGATGAAAADGTVLLASRVIEGAGFMSVVVGVPGLIAAASLPRDRRLAFGIWSTYLPLGVSLTMIATPPLLTLAGWRGVWLAVALLTVACALGVLSARGNYALPASTPRRLRDLLAPLRRAAPWWLAGSFACYNAQWSAVMVWLPTYLLERDVSLATASLATAAYVGINVPGNLLGTWLLQRGAVRGHLIVAACVLMSACGVAALAESVPTGARLAAVLGLSLFGGIIPAAVLASLQVHARTPSEVGGLQGLFVQGAQVGYFVGAPAVATVVAATGRWPSASVVLLAAAGLGVLTGIMVRRLERSIAPA